MADEPHIFIGSSAEGRNLVCDLEEAMRKRPPPGGLRVIPWYESFPAGPTTLESLHDALRDAEYGAFFFLPDDRVVARDQEAVVARDNIVFELGLFMGRHSRRRVFVLYDSTQNVTLPSDLRGLTYVPFRLGEPDEDGRWTISPAELDDLRRILVEQIEASGRPTRMPEDALVVSQDARRRDCYRSIGEAIAAAAEGAVILVRPGQYDEALMIDKPLELIGVGAAGAGVRPLIRSPEGSTLRYSAPGETGRLTNLALEMPHLSPELEPHPYWCTIDVERGGLIVDGCDISGKGHACMMVRNGARAWLDGNVIRDGAGRGIVVDAGGDAPRIAHNRVENHQHTCIELRGGRAVVAANKIARGRAGGVLFVGNARGRIVENEIAAHAFAGVAVTEGAAPEVRGNRISRCRQGVYVGAGCGGQIERNNLFENAVGVEVCRDAQPDVDHNWIFEGTGSGIVLRSGAGGSVTENRVRGHRDSGIVFEHSSAPSQFHENRVYGGRRGVWSGITIPDEWRESNVVVVADPDRAWVPMEEPSDAAQP